MISVSLLILVLLAPLLNFHFVSKRQVDVSYGSPAYKYCECGRKNKQYRENGRVVGGNETVINEYPWMALIVGVDKALPQLICGGSLINDQYVLTAAHCLRSKYTQSQMKVVLGEHDFCHDDTRTVMFSIEKFLQHPKYIESKHLLLDIMLVKLSMRVTFNAFIRPICLPKKVVPKQSADTRYGGKIGEVLGWGIGDTFNASCVLRKTSLIIYLPTQCPFKAFQLFCAGHPDRNSDACVGDSGGPFQILNSEGKYELIGIVSSGIACGDAEAPGLYTDVPYVLPWIYVASQDSMFCWR